MSFILYLLIFIFVLGIIVLVHEFGHFLFARRAKILCHEFSIGMGPVIYKIKKGETTYAIRSIPIGGYVTMAGEEPETDKLKKNQNIHLSIQQGLVRKIYLYQPEIVDNLHFAKVIDYDLYGKDDSQLYIHYEDKQGNSQHVNVARDAYYEFKEGLELQIAPYDRCFESKPWIDRFLAVIAGAGFNFILAIVFFFLVSLMTGVPTSQSIIGPISSNTPASVYGLEAKDQITKINNTSISKWSDISTYMSQYKTGDLTITVLRDGEQKVITLTPEIYIATLGIYSDSNLDNSTTIGEVTANSNADKEGIKAGDQITKVWGTSNDDLNTKTKNESQEYSFDVSNWYQLEDALSHFYLGEKIHLTIQPVTGEAYDKTITTIKALVPENTHSVLIGISPNTEFNLFGSIKYGFTQTGNVIGSIFQTFGLLFGNSNVGVGDLSGPVGIYDMTKTFAMAGFISLLGWVAFISANIGFVNLLPLPALDGGRLIFLFIEAIVRKPVNRKVEGYIHTAGFILFMMLFVYITFNDILRING